MSSLFNGLTDSLVKIGGEVLNFPVEYEETNNPLKFNEEKEPIFLIEEEAKRQILIDVWILFVWINEQLYKSADDYKI